MITAVTGHTNVQSLKYQPTLKPMERIPATLDTMLLCVSMAPLGFPVVPLV